MKKVSLLVLPLTALLAACGGTTVSSAAQPSSSAGASSASEPASSQPAPSSESQPASQSQSASSAEIPDNVTVSFWSTGSQGMTTQLQALAREFEKQIKENTGKTVTMNVTVEGSYADIEDKITKGLSVGNIPTMAVAYPDTVANILAKETDKIHYLYDLDAYMEDEEIGFCTQEFLGDTDVSDRDDIVYSFLDEGTHYVREGTFSYPFMKSSEVMFYNVNDVERAYSFYKPSVQGKDNIRADLKSMDWDEFTNLLTSVMDHKEDILNTLKHALWYDSDSNLFISQLYQRGIPYTDIVDGKGKILFEEGQPRADAEKVLTDLKALYDDGRFTTKGIENTYGSTAFTNGEVLFEVGSSGGTGYNMPEGLEPSDIGIVPVPAAKKDGKANPSYVSQGPTITFLKNPTLTDAQNDAEMYYAWQFAKYLTNPANNVRLCIRGSEGYIPVRYSAYETAEFMDFLDEESIYSMSAKVVIDEIAGSYYSAPVFPGSAELRDKVGGTIGDVLKGTKTASGALKDAIDQAKTHMK